MSIRRDLKKSKKAMKSFSRIYGEFFTSAFSVQPVSPLCICDEIMLELNKKKEVLNESKRFN